MNTTNTHTRNTSSVHKFRSPSFSPPLFYTHTHHFSIKSKYQTVQRPHTSELYYPPLSHTFHSFWSFLQVSTNPTVYTRSPLFSRFFLTHKHIYRLYQKSDCLKIYSLSTTLFTHTHTPILLFYIILYLQPLFKNAKSYDKIKKLKLFPQSKYL